MKSGFYLSAIAAVMCLFAVSCSDDPQAEPVFVLELTDPARNAIVLGADDTGAEVEFVCNGAWTAKLDEEGAVWLSVTPDEGGASGKAQTVALTAGRNDSDKGRSGVLTLMSEGVEPVTISITQKGRIVANTLELCDPKDANIEVGTDEEEFEVEFLSSAEWRAEVAVADWVADREWLKAVPASGTGSTEAQTLTLTVKKQENALARLAEGTVTLVSRERSITISVRQRQSYYCELLDPAQAHIEVPAEGADIDVYFRCNNTWLATADAAVSSWFSCIPPLGQASETAYVTLSVKPNTDSGERHAVAQIIYYDTDYPLEIEVTQLEKAVPAEIIDIPDAALKNKLVTPVYDANGDGELDTHEALKITSFSVENSNPKICDLEGLQYLKNLETLTITNQDITEIDLTPFGKLTAATIKINKQLKSVLVAGNTSVASLDITNTKLTELDLTGCTALESLTCGSLNLTSFDFLIGADNLRYIESNFNKFTSLDMSGFPQLQGLSISYNSGDITSVDFSNNRNLNSFSVMNSKVPTSVDLSNCQNLQNVKLESCGVTELRLPENKQSLGGLFLSQNELETLDVKNAPNCRRCGVRATGCLH